MNLKKTMILLFISLSFLAISCTDKDSAEKLYIHATEEYAKQNFDEAYAYIQKSLSVDKNFYQASLLQAKILFFRNDYEQAKSILEKTIKKNPAFTEARLWLIRTYICIEDFEKAEGLLKKELSYNQNDWRIYYQYALLAGKQDKMDKRLSFCRKAESLLNEADKVFIEEADTWLLLGVRGKALDCLKKAQSISSNPEELEKIIKYVEQGEDILW